MLFVIFFFKQKTAYEMRISDWSSDGCSSDLFAHHVADRVHVAILWFPPRRAHAEPFGPARLGFASRRDHRIDRHQLFSLEPGLEARALAAIAALLSASAGLARQQLRLLHRIGIQGDRKSVG